MTQQRLDQWLHALGFDPASSSLHLASSALAPRHAYAPELRDLLNPQGEIQAEAVFDVEGVPTVTFFVDDGTLLSDGQRLKALRERIWNQGLVSVLLVIREADIVPVPVAPRRKPGSPLKLESARRDGPLSRADIQSGDIRERHADWFNLEERVDRKLLANLRATVGHLTRTETCTGNLYARDAAIGVLIAETGGQNAFIADSSALPEQLVKDAIGSAFTSAGQRCSAARVLFVQDDIADKVMGMLAGAMAELKIGNPGELSTDVGPVIDADALQILNDHAARMDAEARLIAVAPLSADAAHGTFFAPRAYELKDLGQLHKEIFGPVLHVIRWKADQLDAVIDQINATGYGLTLGLHSRIDETVDRVANGVNVGNVYVNRNQIGAVVGVQPFGGQGLSGTGPKAGGPHYLLRFATEKTVTVNTTAAGGNASLLTLGD